MAAAVHHVEKLLTSAEVAALLGYTEQAFRRKRSEGDDLPAATYVGRFPRYKPSVVQAWIDARPKHRPKRKPKSDT